MNHLSLSFFGTFQAKLGDTPLTHFRSAKAQGLLIYLALTVPKAHGRDELATLFWPDEPEKIAKQNLRQALYLLRKLLADHDQGEPFLLITRATVQFNPASDTRLDVADFLAALAAEAWETAVSLYQGDLLPGFAFDSRPFDDWLRQAREQYHRQALNALNKLTAHNLTRADFQTAERFARQQVAMEPWREEAHQQLMQALALQGERSAALTQFERCQTVLAEELGIEPTTETVNLARRIREAAAAQPAQRERQRLTMPLCSWTASDPYGKSTGHRSTTNGRRLVVNACRRCSKSFAAGSIVSPNKRDSC